MRKREDVPRWRRRREEAATQAGVVGAGREHAPAPNSPTLSQSEHLHGLWIALGLGDEDERGSPVERAAATGQS